LDLRQRAGNTATSSHHPQGSNVAEGWPPAPTHAHVAGDTALTARGRRLHCQSSTRRVGAARSPPPLSLAAARWLLPTGSSQLRRGRRDGDGEEDESTQVFVLPTVAQFFLSAFYSFYSEYMQTCTNRLSYKPAPRSVD
jgi:hypothetical protein